MPLPMPSQAINILWDLFMLDTFSFFEAAIWHALNHYAFGDAAFLAERLFAEGMSFSEYYWHNCKFSTSPNFC